MTNKKKATPESSHKYSTNDSITKQLGKFDSMLLRFAKGERHNRFTAEQVGDHALPSTVSDLQQRNGLYFTRKWIKVPNRFGGNTHVMSYWLAGKHLKKAQQIMGVKV